jgi:hypothetical protein
MKHIFLLLLAIAIFSCKSSEPTATTSDGAFFGEEFTVDKTLNVQDAMAGLASKDTLNIQLAGTVESVCKKKGCWTNIATENNPDESFFVKFKDYGFFLPLDCEGQEVVMQGKAYLEVTPVDELRHYAEDEGKSKEEIEAITEPQEEYKFMASGVFLKNKAAQ